MHYLRDQCETLQSAWTEILEQQQRSEILELVLVGHSQYRTQPLEINVFGTHIMMDWSFQLSHFAESCFRMFSDHCKHGLLSRFRVAVHEIHNGALVLADDARVGL